MRTKVIAGNWKMYKTAAEAGQLAREVVTRSAGGPQVIVAPPFTSLPAAADALKGTPVRLAGQNMHWETEGAFTGEVSGPMLRALGCTHVILGHSERRTLFGETDEGVARKTVAALQHGLVPIVCIGETLPERESDQTMAVVGRQLEAALKALSSEQVASLLLAYEPVWAIGTGRTATPAQAQEVHAFVRAQVARSHGDAAAQAVRILYGGSVKADNAATLLSQPDVDGALVGGASLKAEDFGKIVDAGRS